MGAQFASAHSALNMKLLVVLALAAIAAAEPEAEAKADPYLLYGGYGLGHYGYGLGYHGLGYRTYVYYGKREAEAEPKAEAEPYLYGYGYGLGHYGYGRSLPLWWLLRSWTGLRLRLRSWLQGILLRI